MTPGRRLADRIRRNEPLPILVGVFLTAATPIVRVGMWRRLHGPRIRLDARVFSYGNITAGGTGKTPAVIERVRQEIDAGHRVAVLTRGYGSQSTPEPYLVDTNRDCRDLARVVGDEPALIAQKVPGVIIAKGADRVAGGRRVIEAFQCDTLILDDGFQYVRLERDEDIVVVDATNPFGNGRLLPRGMLREPVRALARATHFILTRCDQAEALDVTINKLREINPHAPIRLTHHRPVAIRHLAGKKLNTLEWLRDRDIDGACGIGNPEAFTRTLESLGARVNRMYSTGDHQAIAPNAFAQSKQVVITEKDAVRFTTPPDNVYALEIELCDYP